MGKGLLPLASLLLLGACGGRADTTDPETNISRTAPGASDPGGPTTGTGPSAPAGPEHVADEIGAPSALAIAPDAVLFTTSKTMLGDRLVGAGALFVADKHIPKALMIGLDRQGAAWSALATDGTTAFVATSDARIVAVPVMGGDARVVATLDAPATTLTASATHVFFANEAGGIARVAKAGGEAEPLGAVDGAVRGLEADDAAVYVATAGGSGGGITRIALGADHEAKVLTDSSEPCAMIRDGRRLFWTSSGKGTVMKLSLEGGDVATVTAGSFSACAIAADDKNLWFATTIPGTLQVKSSGSDDVASSGLGLMRAPIAGGTPVSVAGAARALPQAGAVAVDPSHVYWLTSTSVLRLRK